MATKRMRITALLETNPFTALEISKNVGVKEKEVYEHLFHIQKSAKGRGKKLKITPYRCMACGFEFKDRETVNPAEPVSQMQGGADIRGLVSDPVIHTHSRASVL